MKNRVTVPVIFMWFFLKSIQIEDSSLTYAYFYRNNFIKLRRIQRTYKAIRPSGKIHNLEVHVNILQFTYTSKLKEFIVYQIRSKYYD